MITEFTCGIHYKAVFNSIGGDKWLLKVDDVVIAIIDVLGEYIEPTHLFPKLTTSNELLKIAVLMNNIKRQYKQLNNATINS